MNNTLKLSTVLFYCLYLLISCRESPKIVNFENRLPGIWVNKYSQEAFEFDKNGKVTFYLPQKSYNNLKYSFRLYDELIIESTDSSRKDYAVLYKVRMDDKGQLLLASDDNVQITFHKVSSIDQMYLEFNAQDEYNYYREIEKLVNNQINYIRKNAQNYYEHEKTFALFPIRSYLFKNCSTYVNSANNIQLDITVMSREESSVIYQAIITPLEVQTKLLSFPNFR